MFNFCVNNVVGKPIIDKGLFYIFKFIKEDSSLALEISVFMIVLIYKSKVSKVGNHNRGQPEGSLFNSYYTEV